MSNQNRKAAIRKPSGQNITEYGFIIAFVGILIAVAFNLLQGSLFAGVSSSVSSATNQVTRLNTAAVRGTLGDTSTTSR